MSKSPNELEQLVLLALTHLGDDGYGVTVRREIAHRTGSRPSMAAVYAALGRLEDQALAASWISDPTPKRGGRAKKHFRIEPAGLEALRDARMRMDRMWDGIELAPDAGG